MTSASNSSPSATESPRLVVKSQTPATGFVDGAWWPASRDLAAELPAVAAELAARLGGIESVSYNINAWTLPARKIDIDGTVVRMSGFRTQNHDTVDVIGAKRRLVLLVVPPETDPAVANDALAAAGRDGNADDIAALLLASTAA